MRDEVLEGLAAADEGFARQVRKAIFTFADITERIEARDISRVIRGVEQATLVTVLAGATSATDAAVGEFILPGLLKISTVRKPAVKARKGINPFTKEEVMFKAKPASTTVKVRPLKKLKDMVL